MMRYFLLLLCAASVLRAELPSDASASAKAVASLAEWGAKLDALESGDPAGYTHFTELHAGKAHWMDTEDRKAIPWMEKFTRKPLPERIAWHQDDVTHTSYYWLGLPEDAVKVGQEVTAVRNAQVITLHTKDVPRLFVRLNDAMLDLDQAVTIRAGDRAVSSARAVRTIGTLARTLEERGDRELMFSAEVPVVF